MRFLREWDRRAERLLEQARYCFGDDSDDSGDSDGYDSGSYQEDSISQGLESAGIGVTDSGSYQEDGITQGLEGAGIGTPADSGDAAPAASMPSPGEQMESWLDGTWGLNDFEDAQGRSLTESLAAQAEAQAARDAARSANPTMGATNTAIDGTGIGPSATNDHAAPGVRGEHGFTDAAYANAIDNEIARTKDDYAKLGKVVDVLGIVSPVAGKIGRGVLSLAEQNAIGQAAQGKGVANPDGTFADGTSSGAGGWGGGGTWAENDPAGGGGESGDGPVTTPAAGGSGVNQPGDGDKAQGGTSGIPALDLTSLGGLRFFRPNYDSLRGQPKPPTTPVQVSIGPAGAQEAQNSNQSDIRQIPERSIDWGSYQNA
jgi:hypothetical protein